MANGWYSAQELAGLPEMPGTERRVRARAEKNLWVSRSKLRGKGVEHPLNCLPTETQDALIKREISQSAGVSTISPAAATPLYPVALPAAHELKDWQRKAAEARSAIINEIKRLGKAAGTEKAIQAVIALAANGE